MWKARSHPLSFANQEERAQQSYERSLCSLASWRFPHTEKYFKKKALLT